MGEDVHVLPLNDLRDHDETADCWCKPRRDEDEPRVVIHNSLDQRELHETGKRAIQ